MEESIKEEVRGDQEEETGEESNSVTFTQVSEASQFGILRKKSSFVVAWFMQFYPQTYKNLLDSKTFYTQVHS